MTAVRPEHLYDRHAGTDDLPADGITRASGMAPRPPGKVPAPQENHGGQMTTMIRRITRQLSVPTTLLATTCAAAGTVTGLFIYLDRSPIRHKYLPGSSAYWQQAAIAGVALLLYGYSWWRHQRRPGHQPGRLLLLAPLGKPAARRFARTMRQAVRSPSGFARAVATLPFTGLLIYCAWRIGEQITAGLDPNWTVNAWGGPSYFGAMACHYLAALDRLVRGPAGQQRGRGNHHLRAGDRRLDGGLLMAPAGMAVSVRGGPRRSRNHDPGRKPPMRQIRAP